MKTIQLVTKTRVAVVVSGALIALTGYQLLTTPSVKLGESKSVTTHIGSDCYYGYAKAFGREWRGKADDLFFEGGEGYDGTLRVTEPVYFWSDDDRMITAIFETDDGHTIKMLGKHPDGQRLWTMDCPIRPKN